MKQIIQHRSYPKFHLNEILFRIFTDDKIIVFPWISFRMLNYYVIYYKDYISMNDGDLELILKDNIYFDFKYLNNDRSDMDNAIFRKNQNRIFYKSDQLIYNINFDDFFKLNTSFFCEYCDYYKSKVCNKDYDIVCNQVELGGLI